MMVQCKDIKKYFPIKRGFLREDVGQVNAVDGVSLGVNKGSVYGVVGESGSGKTTLGKLILGVIRPDSGEVSLNAKRAQAIFQDPYSSLDPSMRVIDILREGLIVQKNISDMDKKVGEIIDLVKLPRQSLNKYPHQFSGGERQRIAIARALVTQPDFIVCDEPVSSLDVTIQLQILLLLKEVQKRLGITYLFISHDLRVIRFMCDRVAVMREGRVIEEGPVSDIYSRPAQAYTKTLLASVLRV